MTEKKGLIIIFNSIYKKVLGVSYTKVAVYGLRLHVTVDDEYNKLPRTERATRQHKTF